MSAAVFIKTGVRTILSGTHTQNEWHGFYEVYPKYHGNDDADDDRNHLLFATQSHWLTIQKKNYR